MARDIKEILREVLDRTDEEDRSGTLEARLVALEEREQAGATITTAQIIAALEGATDEELEALHGTVVDRLAREVEDLRNPPDPPPPDPPPPPPPPPEPVAETRPGRKQGQAYNWEVDDDGQVVSLNVARIWNEPDEDDELPLPQAPVVEEPPA